MLGTTVNALAIILGSLLGYFLIPPLSERIQKTVLNGIALGIILIGISKALKSEEYLIIIVSLAFGGLLGESLKIQQGIETLGEKLQKRADSRYGDVATGFITATLVFMIGAMAVVGAIDSGLNNDHSILFAKALIDGIVAIVFASTLGIGVMLSAIPVFIYQGSIALLAGFFAALLSAEILAVMESIGGLLIALIGLNMLGVTKARVANLLPAMFIGPVIVMGIQVWFS